MSKRTSSGPEIENIDQSPRPGDVNNFLTRTLIDKDFLYVADSKRAFSGETVRMEWDPSIKALAVVRGNNGLPRTARYTSPVIKCKFAASEFLPSWNIKLGDLTSQGFCISVRVYNSEEKASPWFFIGEGGSWDHSGNIKTKAPGWGRTNIDYLDLNAPVSSFQYRIDFIITDTAAESAPAVHRFFMHYSGKGKVSAEGTGSINGKMVRVKVPYRSQLDVEDETLRHHVCCPTCVAMVLEQYGVNHSTLSVCRAIYNKRYDMHGIWPQASQVAYQYGCRAWVDRFRSMAGVRAYLETGKAIIASIRVGEGELRHARYPRSNGHLIVITGLKKNKVIVNDPYSAGPKGGEIEYETEDIEKVWLDRGGVAILIENTN